MAKSAWFEIDYTSGNITEPEGGSLAASRIAWDPWQQSATVRYTVTDELYAEMKTGVQSEVFTWLADTGSPVKDRALTAQQARRVRDRLLDLYPPAARGLDFGQIMAAVGQAIGTRELARIVVEDLHHHTMEKAER